MVDHPWVLVVAVIACGPLIWVTFLRLFPDFRGDIEEDGLWRVVGAETGFGVATWSLLKVIVFLFLCAAYVTAAYKLAVWLYG